MQVAKVAPSRRPEKEMESRMRSEAESDDRASECELAEASDWWRGVYLLGFPLSAEEVHQ